MMEPKDYKPYTTIEQIKEANRRGGQNWFSASTTRWWKCRVSSTVIVSADNLASYFVTSERMDNSTPRRYTVRAMVAGSGRVQTVSDFGEYRSLGGAVGAARRYASKDTRTVVGTYGSYIAEEA